MERLSTQELLTTVNALAKGKMVRIEVHGAIPEIPISFKEMPFENFVHEVAEWHIKRRAPNDQMFIRTMGANADKETELAKGDTKATAPDVFGVDWDAMRKELAKDEEDTE